MPRTITFADRTAAFHARYPNVAEPGQLASVSASAATTLDSVQAGAIKGFSSASGQLKWVKAVEHFYAGVGELVQTNDFVQVLDADAKSLVHSGRAVLATDDEVAVAQGK